MTDLDQILPLWHALRESGTEYVLATVVTVEGSGYRKPGARMLIAADGRRAGTISGGCLEAEVARKAFWRTENGPVVRRYSTAAEDGEVPYGMGCGGIVHLLLERSETAGPMMERLAASFERREPITIATVLEGDRIGQRVCWPAGDLDTDSTNGLLKELACRGFEEQRSFSDSMQTENLELAAIRIEWNAARPGLFVFGAGDDAIPLVRQARQLGWYVAVADGRAHLVTQARFPEAHAVHVLASGNLSGLGMRSGDAAAVMTHSLEQDTRFLSALLREKPAYVGVLGPQRRTGEMLLSLALESGVRETQVDAQVENWMERLYAPMGLDLGGNTPADIALAIIAEIQQCRHRASGMAMRVVRARDKSIA